MKKVCLTAVGESRDSVPFVLCMCAPKAKSLDPSFRWDDGTLIEVREQAN